jgi:hypothetical protein
MGKGYPKCCGAYSYKEGLWRLAGTCVTPRSNRETRKYLTSMSCGCVLCHDDKLSLVIQLALTLFPLENLSKFPSHWASFWGTRVYFKVVDMETRTGQDVAGSDIYTKLGLQLPASCEPPQLGVPRKQLVWIVSLLGNICLDV